MTEKDRSDLEAALDAGVDWIALSFVQRPEDVAEVKKVARGRALVMSKLEKPQAISDRKSTRLNSSHANISYAVFCLKKKNDTHTSAALRRPSSADWEIGRAHV